MIAILSFVLNLTHSIIFKLRLYILLRIPEGNGKQEVLIYASILLFLNIFLFTLPKLHHVYGRRSSVIVAVERRALIT